MNCRTRDDSIVWFVRYGSSNATSAGPPAVTADGDSVGCRVCGVGPAVSQVGPSIASTFRNNIDTNIDATINTFIDTIIDEIIEQLLTQCRSIISQPFVW